MENKWSIYRIQLWFSYINVVTHRSINQAQCGATLSLKVEEIPLSQAVMCHAYTYCGKVFA